MKVFGGYRAGVGLSLPLRIERPEEGQCDESTGQPSRGQRTASQTELRRKHRNNLSSEFQLPTWESRNQKITSTDRGAKLEPYFGVETAPDIR